MFSKIPHAIFVIGPQRNSNSAFLKFMIEQNVAVALARLKILNAPGIRSYAPPIVPRAEMLLWPLPASIFRSMAWYNGHCYHENHQKVTIIIRILGILDFCSSSSSYNFAQQR